MILAEGKGASDIDNIHVDKTRADSRVPQVYIIFHNQMIAF